MQEELFKEYTPHGDVSYLMYRHQCGCVQKPSGEWYSVQGDCPNHPERVMNDPVNHPAHYTQGKIEVYDFIQDQQLNYPRGCVIKYVCRALHKGHELEDLMKASWYLTREIERLKNNEPNKNT